AVLDLARQQRQRIDVECAAELVLGQAEQLHQPHRPLALLAVARQNSWFSPPNTSLTDPSVKIWRIELVSRSAHDSTRTLSGAPAGSGMVSVTTISSSRAARSCSHGSPEKTPWVAAAYTRRAPAS